MSKLNKAIDEMKKAYYLARYSAKYKDNKNTEVFLRVFKNG